MGVLPRRLLSCSLALVVMTGGAATLLAQAPQPGLADDPTASAEDDRLRNLATEFARRVVLLQPGEGLPVHFIARDYTGMIRASYRPFHDLVSPAMLFETAVYDLAAEKGMSAEELRAALRKFTAQVASKKAAELLDAALSSFVARRYAEAEQRALNAAAQGPKPAESRAALLLAGDAQMLQSKFWEAENSYRAAARLSPESDHPAWLETQWKLSQALGQNNDLYASKRLWKKIAAVSTAQNGPNARPTLAARRWVLCETVLSDMAPHDGPTEDDKAMEAVLAAQRGYLGADDLDVARSLSAMRQSMETFDRQLGEALAICEKRLGPANPGTLRVLRNLARWMRVGLSLQKADQRARGASFARRAVAASEQIFGPENPEVASDLSLLADFAESREEFDAFSKRIDVIHESQFDVDSKAAERQSAEDLRIFLADPMQLEQALRKRISPPERDRAQLPPALAPSVVALDHHLEDLPSEDNEKKLALERSALALCDALLGDTPEDVPDPRDRIALLRLQLNVLKDLPRRIDPEVVKAEHLEYRARLALSSLLKDEIAMQERLLGAEHPDVADYLEQYADSLSLWGKLAEAEPLWRRVLEIRLNAFGPENWRVFHAARELGELAEERLRPADAEALARRMVSVQEQWTDGAPDSLATWVARLASLLQKQGKAEEAERLRRRAAAFWDSTPEDDRSEARFENLRDLAVLVRIKGDLNEAVTLYRRVMVLKREAHHFADELVPIGEILGDLGRFEEAEAALKSAFKNHEDRSALAGENYEDGGMLGVLCAQEGRYAEARPLLAAAIAGLQAREAEWKARDAEERKSMGNAPAAAPSGKEAPSQAAVEYFAKVAALKPMARFEKYLSKTDAALANLSPEAPAK